MNAGYWPTAHPLDLMEELASALDAWFSVSGDMEDFIYYDNSEKTHSER